LLDLYRQYQAIYASKENTMKTIVTAIASTFLVSAAFAAPPTQLAAAPATASPAAMASGDMKRDMKVEEQIKSLHAKLKINPDEETKWAVVAKTMRESAKDLDTVIDKRKATHDTASAVDDLTAYGDIAQAHADGVKKLASAFAPLYAAMPDDQKRTADEVFANRQHAKK
jgi:protein CpxP